MEPVMTTQARVAPTLESNSMHIHPSSDMNPKIVISTSDFDRLEALADSLAAAEGATKQALLGELARAEVVEANQLPPTVVAMNSTVRFRIESKDEEFNLTLVYPRDAGKFPNTISVLTPVGTALLGMPAGGRIQWPRPDGEILEVRILSIAH
jgi:regulator of nucleoside diphosphate kinase